MLRAVFTQGFSLLAVMKQGPPGGGNYITASAAYVDVDAVNLAYTVTVPLGKKLLIRASGVVFSTTVINNVVVAITDGATVLADTNGGGTGIGRADSNHCFALDYLFVGDGLAHTFKLRFLALNGVNNAVIYNPAGVTGVGPRMTFLMFDSI